MDVVYVSMLSLLGKIDILNLGGIFVCLVPLGFELGALYSLEPWPRPFSFSYFWTECHVYVQAGLDSDPPGLYLPSS
jgi:hypothetical protein